MSSHSLPGDPSIPLVLRRSKRAKRISLRVSQLDGRVTLTLPNRLPEAEALAFAQEKEVWLRKQLNSRSVDIEVAVGAEIPINGVVHTIARGDGQRVVIGGGKVLVPGAAERVGRRLGGHIKQIARSRMAEASDHYAHKLGKQYSAITIRDTRSRWGSCTSEGRLMYSWRLILAPPEVLDYVVAHEVAHLAQMNHSNAFWTEVERIYGDYRAPRKWLRQEGGALHRYRFGA